MTALTHDQMRVLSYFASGPNNKRGFPADDWRRVDALERRGLLWKARFGYYHITTTGREVLNNDRP